MLCSVQPVQNEIHQSSENRCDNLLLLLLVVCSAVLSTTAMHVVCVGAAYPPLQRRTENKPPASSYWWQMVGRKARTAKKRGAPAWHDMILSSSSSPPVTAATRCSLVMVRHIGHRDRGVAAAAAVASLWVDWSHRCVVKDALCWVFTKDGQAAGSAERPVAGPRGSAVA